MKQMIIKLTCLLFSVFVSVVNASEIPKVNLTGVNLLNSQTEIIVSKKILDRNPNDLICKGSEIVTMPALGECPDKPGYVEIGFPTCTQNFEVPKKFMAKEIFPGFVKLVCSLDYENAIPVDYPVCDYSMCSYIAEPKL